MLNPTSTQIKDFIRQGNQLKKAGKLTEAQEKYTAALEVNPQSVPALNQLGKIYEQQQDYEQAIPYLQQIVQHKPDNIEFQERLADALMKTKDFSAAATTYQAALLLQPEDPKLLYNSLAEALAKQGEPSQAIAVYQNLLNSEVTKLLQDNPRLGDVIIQLSIRQGTLKQAVTAFQKACQHQPLNPWHHYYLAIALAKQGKTDEAIRAYRQAIQIQPNLFQAYLELGKVLMKEKKGDELFDCCIKALKIKPNDGKAHSLLRIWLSRFSRSVSQEALKEKAQVYQTIYDQLKQDQSQPIVSHLNMSSFLMKLDRLAEAIQCNQKAIYNQLYQSQPKFVTQYWKENQLSKPDFLIIGVAKCGTTSLYKYMVKHPKILPSLVKELNMFGLSQNREEFKLDYYLSFFPPFKQSDGFITGEASTSYIHTKGVENLVCDYFPDIKIIVILRDPVKRFISHYQQAVRGVMQEKRSLEKAINAGLKEVKKINDPYQSIETAHNKHLVDGMYVYFLERWMNVFPEKKFLILRNEDLAQYPRKVMKQVFEFLNVPDYEKIDFVAKNTGTYSSQVDESLLSQLYEFYRPHNQRLEEFLGRKFDWELSSI